jgi:GTP pyrophosphokinase
MKLFKKRVLISDLCEVLDHYMPKNHVEMVYQAYIMAATAHDGQFRKSGEAYVFHPINVAMILAELQLDYACIVAALLHDCIEDTTLTQEEISIDFGEEVANIVEGVSKITGLRFNSITDKQAQNFRKLILAMTSDMRVMVIKLADRLHNMRTLDSMDEEKRVRIAKETYEIHAPIARRLGLNSIRTELDNLCFKYLHPFRYKIITSKINKQKGSKRKLIRHIEKEINNRFINEGMAEVEVTGRRKQPSSIYNKMKLKGVKFSQVLDMFAFRVIVSDVSMCYQALGIVHNLYKPLPGKFKDYIALPKSNGYQSLHTVLFGPDKILIEVQVRSQDMHFISEYGIAAHWHYKNTPGGTPELAANWLGSLLDIQKKSGTSVDFLEETKTDLFPSEVFVFTPVGDIIQLPYKSTVIDFAYAVHTDIGNRTVKAKIDQASVPLSTEIRSGNTIEIITSKKAKPHSSWLQTAVTAKAKSAIKTQLKKESSSELMQLGDYLLSNALTYQGLNYKDINKDTWRKCLSDLRCDSKSDLYMKIGLSEILISVVLNKLQDDKDEKVIEKIHINKTRGKAISFAHCCYPIPGDRVAAILTTSKGLVVHKFECKNLQREKSKNIQWLEVDWDADKSEEFEATVIVKVNNRRGALASIANVLAKMGINIENLDIEEQKNSMKALNFIITVSDTKKLTEVFSKLEKFEFVRSVSRSK